MYIRGSYGGIMQLLREFVRQGSRVFVSCVTIFFGLAASNVAQAAAVACDPTTVNIAAEDTMTCAGIDDLGAAGITSVLNGNLIIDGTLTNDFTNVSSSATLGGMGTINGDVFVDGTLIASAGDLSITGNLSLASGSSLAVTLGGGTSTKVDVTGSATIDNGTNLILMGDLAQDAVVTVLTATTGVTGDFENVTDDQGNLLAYATIAGANDVKFGNALILVGVSEVVHQAVTGVTLDAHRGVLNTIHARIDHRYRDSAHKRTKRNSFAGYDNPSTGSLMNSQLNAHRADLWSNDLSKAMQSDAHTPGFIADMIATEQTGRERMHRSMSALPRLQVSSNYGGMWLEGFGMTSRQEAQTAVTGYKASASGVSIGLDSRAANEWTFGGMVGYGLSDVDLQYDAGAADGETVYIGGYMANISRTHFANLFVTAAIAKYDADRVVTDGVTSDIASDEFGSYMWDARLELGRTYSITEDDFFRPNVAIEYISAYQDDYVDDGAGIVPGLTVEEHSTRIFRAEGQLDALFGSMNIDDKGWSGRFFGGLAHEVILDDQSTEAFVAGFDDPISLSTGGDDHRTSSSMAPPFPGPGVSACASSSRIRANPIQNSNATTWWRAFRSAGSHSRQALTTLKPGFDFEAGFLQ